MIVIQEGIKPLQLLCESLDMVKSVHANNDFHSFVSLFERLDASPDFRLLQGIGEFLRINSHNEFVSANQSISVLNLIWNFGSCATEREGKSRGQELAI